MYIQKLSLETYSIYTHVIIYLCIQFYGKEGIILVHKKANTLTRQFGVYSQ